MNITQALITLDVAQETGWSVDWLWGVPLIVSTVVFHVTGLGLINRWVDRLTTDTIMRHHRIRAFMLVMAGVTLLATVLHAAEVIIWCLAYLAVGALPDGKTAMLYSLNAMTSYGHDNVMLEERWRLLGAIEALNGWLLFGLTTAFLFGTMVRFRSSTEGQKPR